MRVLKDCGAKISSHTYENNNLIVFQIKKQNSLKLEKDFTDIYTAKLTSLRTL